jgi:hypothetical protein
LNEGSKSEQLTRPVDLRDDGVDIDLPSREEIEGALKYLKNNKVAGADFIAAELLKNGGPNLVNALHEVIHMRYAARKSKMVSTGEGTTTNLITSLP